MMYCAGGLSPTPKKRRLARCSRVTGQGRLNHPVCGHYPNNRVKSYSNTNTFDITSQKGGLFFKVVISSFQHRQKGKGMGLGATTLSFHRFLFRGMFSMGGTFRPARRSLRCTGGPYVSSGDARGAASFLRRGRGGLAPIPFKMGQVLHPGRPRGLVRLLSSAGASLAGGLSPAEALADWDKACSLERGWSIESTAAKSAEPFTRSARGRASSSRWAEIIESQIKVDWLLSAAAIFGTDESPSIWAAIPPQQDQAPQISAAEIKRGLYITHAVNGGWGFLGILAACRPPRHRVKAEACSSIGTGQADTDQSGTIYGESE